jgi:hypothetical protein
MPQIITKLLLEDTLKNVWNNKLEEYNYPNVSDPKMIYPKSVSTNNTNSNTCTKGVCPQKRPSLNENLSEDDVSTATISMLNHELIINYSFIAYLMKCGLNLEDSLDAIISHELEHYVYCPYDLKMHHLLQKASARVSRINAPLIANYFEDAVVNLNSMLNRKSRSIPLLYTFLKKISPVDKLVVGLYECKTGIDMRNELNQRLKKKLIRLERIDYFDDASWILNVQEFGKTIVDLLSNNQQLIMFDNFNHDAYSVSEKKMFIKEILDEISPKQYKKFMDKLHPQHQHDSKQKANTHQNSAQNSNVNPNALVPGQTINTVDKNTHIIGYYAELARKHSAIISPMISQSSKYHENSEHKKWELSDSPSSIDIFNSYGKIMPGITQAWNSASSNGPMPFSTMPDLFISIDSSSSMTDPSRKRSLAVEYSFVLIENYIACNKNVATHNFSDNDYITKFSSDKTATLTNIILFQGGGNSSYDTKMLEKQLGLKNRKIDVVLLSDMAIGGDDIIAKYFASMQSINRLTFICIDDNNIYSSISDKGISGEGLKGFSRKVNHYIIKSPSDIKKIVIKELKEYS